MNIEKIQIINSLIFFINRAQAISQERINKIFTQINDQINKEITNNETKKNSLKAYLDQLKKEIMNDFLQKEPQESVDKDILNFLKKELIDFYDQESKKEEYNGQQNIFIKLKGLDLSKMDDEIKNYLVNEELYSDLGNIISYDKNTKDLLRLLNFDKNKFFFSKFPKLLNFFDLRNDLDKDTNEKKFLNYHEYLLKKNCLELKKFNDSYIEFVNFNSKIINDENFLLNFNSEIINDENFLLNFNSEIINDENFLLNFNNENTDSNFNKKINTFIHLDDQAKKTYIKNISELSILVKKSKENDKDNEIYKKINDKIIYIAYTFNNYILKDKTHHEKEILKYHIYAFRENLIKSQLYRKFFKIQENLIFYNKIFTLSENELNLEVNKFAPFYSMNDDKKSLFLKEVERIKDENKGFKNFEVVFARFNKAKSSTGIDQRLKKIHKSLDLSSLFIYVFYIPIALYVITSFYFSLIIKFFLSKYTNAERIFNKIYNSKASKAIFLIYKSLFFASLIIIAIDLVSFLIDFFSMKEERYQDELLEHKGNLLKKFCQKESIQINPNIKNIIENKDFLLKILFCNMNNEEEFKNIISYGIGILDQKSDEKIKEDSKKTIEDFFISIKNQVNESYQDNFTKKGLDQNKEVTHKDTALHQNLFFFNTKINNIAFFKQEMMKKEKPNQIQINEIEETKSNIGKS